MSGRGGRWNWYDTISPGDEIEETNEPPAKKQKVDDTKGSKK